MTALSTLTVTYIICNAALFVKLQHHHFAIVLFLLLAVTRIAEIDGARRGPGDQVIVTVAEIKGIRCGPGNLGFLFGLQGRLGPAPDSLHARRRGR